MHASFEHLESDRVHQAIDEKTTQIPRLVSTGGSQIGKCVLFCSCHVRALLAATKRWLSKNKRTSAVS